MIRSLRVATPVVAALVLALAGCSSSTIDIPEGAVVSAAPTRVPVESAPVESAPAQSTPEASATVETEEPAPVTETLDCATVLPVETIEAALELPAGFVTPSSTGAGCSWSMAGNTSALVLQTATGATSDSLAQQEAAGATEPSDLGDQAFFRAGDPAVDPAATLVVLAADRLLSLRSYVGDQEPLESLAADVFSALGQDPA
ncbi:hypothetical protein SAMN06295885_0543 [Rathayibacter oskolensis]|uniref:DUF3558 domain-containing protein n=1 Tax=Rathayibacter oskolensis TaxID=1891671 RepID=A0A1X7N1I6_9MICO|nr:hypothetical protein [Rathayibacter oskolensis]SMH31129.1 hypothetical protein SAMN06295885_0543 [Rathayibacter oskolensis]